jgi:hypothetical protein
VERVIYFFEKLSDRAAGAGFRKTIARGRELDAAAPDLAAARAKRATTAPVTPSAPKVGGMATNPLPVQPAATKQPPLTRKGNKIKLNTSLRRPGLTDQEKEQKKRDDVDPEIMGQKLYDRGKRRVAAKVVADRLRQRDAAAASPVPPEPAEPTPVPAAAPPAPVVEPEKKTLTPDEHIAQRRQRRRDLGYADPKPDAPPVIADYAAAHAPKEPKAPKEPSAPVAPREKTKLAKVASIFDHPRTDILVNTATGIAKKGTGFIRASTKLKYKY